MVIDLEHISIQMSMRTTRNYRNRPDRPVHRTRVVDQLLLHPINKACQSTRNKYHLMLLQPNE